MGSICILILLPIMILIKIITKKQTAVFVMIFLSAFIGNLITLNAIKEKNTVYSMKEQTVSVIGTVDKIEESRFGWNIYLEDVKIDDCECNKILIAMETQPSIRIGNRIKSEAVLKHFEQARNPGNFDSQKYYMTLGIYAKLEAEKVIVLNASYDALRESLSILRMCIQDKLKSICGDEYNGFWNVCNEKADTYAAILLGEKKELDSEIKNLYSMSGITHILAISGLHISFIGISVYSLLRRRFKFSFCAFFSIVVVVGFGLLSGLGIATARAMVMFVLRLLGEALGRTYDNLTAISTAGLMLMMSNPFVILNSGFQMSFAAIVAIVLIWPIICNILQLNDDKTRQMKIYENDMDIQQRCRIGLIKFRNKILKSMIFSLNIGLVMNPIIAYSYFQLPTYSFLLNMLIVPLMSVVIVSGILGIGISFVSIEFGRILMFPGCLILELYTILCQWSSKLPFANVIVGRPSYVSIIIYYIIFILFLWAANKIRNKSVIREKQRENTVGAEGKIIESKVSKVKRKNKLNRKYSIALASTFWVMNCLIYIPFFNNPSSMANKKGLQVTFLDVGQGDGIFLHTDDGTNITVDGGSTSVEKVGQYRIIPFLKSQCIKNIDYAIMTHADNDHISGLLEMLNQSDHGGVKIKNLILPDIQLKDKAYNNMIETALKNKVNVLYITEGNEFRIEKLNIKCLYPSVSTSAKDRNDYSTVLSVEYGKFSMLLSGDISTEPEEAIRNTLKNHYTVLKVAHHGSKYSTSMELLNYIKPDYSVISVGQHNMYGHPSTETLKRLAKNESKVLRTDECGGITVSTDGENIEIIN